MEGGRATVDHTRAHTRSLTHSLTHTHTHTHTQAAERTKVIVSTRSDIDLLRRPLLRARGSMRATALKEKMTPEAVETMQKEIQVCVFVCLSVWVWVSLCV